MSSFEFVEKVMTIGSTTGNEVPILQFYKKGFVLGSGKVEPTWQDIILHGNTALTLVNAKADSLNYLKLYGACEYVPKSYVDSAILYGGTELLPSTYLDTVTLSGGCRQSNLPEGYTQVEYLEVKTVGAYFLTGINATVDTDMGITASNITANTSQLLIAQCESGSDYFRIAKESASQKIAGRFASSSVTDNNSDGVNKFTARLNKSGFYVDGSLVGTFSNVPSSFTGIGDIDIFRGKYSNSIYYAYADSRFHSAWVDDNIFLPCRRNSDNQLGIYNTKTGEFILPGGSGTFTAGPDITVPSPDTPMDIVCNNGTIKVSKNVFDYEYFYDNYQIYIGTQVGRCPIKLQPNTQYTVSTNTETSSSSSKIFVRSGSDINWTPVSADNGVLVNRPRTVTTDSNGYLCLGIYVTGVSAIPESDFVNGTVWVQIEQGSTATPYMPYGIYTDGTQEVVTDSLGNTANAERLLAAGDYKDTQEIISGSVTRRVGIKVLDGTEGWLLATGTGYRQFYTSTTQGVIKNSVSLVSNIAPYGCTAVTRTDYDFGCYSGSTGFLCFQMIGSSTLTTVAEFKQYLATQYAQGTPVIVVYPLATATTETVTGQFLSKSPVTQTAGSISGLPIAITESGHTVPTPQQPLQINCNNGVVKYQTYGLPAGYTKLSYLESSGTQYIDTGIVPTNTTGWKVTLNMPNVQDDQAKFGCRNDNSDTRFWFGCVNGKAYFGWGTNYPTSANRPSISADTDNTVSCNYLNNRNCVLNDTVAYSNLPTLPFTPTKSIWLLGANTGTGAYRSYKLYEAIFTEGNAIIMHLIPAKRNSDNVLGLYDTVGKTFLTNQGTGTFIAGTEQTAYIYTDGTTETVEIDTTGDTATAQPLYKVGTYQDIQSVITGEVTRKVGIKVLDGTENWTEVSGSSAPFALVVDDFESMNMGTSILVYSTHFQGVPASATWSNYNSIISFTGSQGSEVKTFRVRYLANTKTLAEFKQFLAEQYTNGTPVICVYCKTPTTETVTPQELTVQDGTNQLIITQASMTGLTTDFAYSVHTQPSATQPLQIRCNNGVLSANAQNQIVVTGTTETVEIDTTGDTATAENLYKVGDYQDVHSVLDGIVTRNCNVVLYDGTQTINTPYMSTTGGLNTGAIIVYPLATPTTETVTPQSLSIQEGTNTIEITQASIDNLSLEASYKRTI